MKLRKGSFVENKNVNLAHKTDYELDYVEICILRILLPDPNPKGSGFQDEF